MQYVYTVSLIDKDIKPLIHEKFISRNRTLQILVHVYCKTVLLASELISEYIKGKI